MKTFAFCAFLGALSFGAMGFQMGLFQEPPPVVKSAEEPARPEVKVEAPRARFPQDLALAVRRMPIPAAAAFDAKAKTHRVVFLSASGALHAWQEYVQEDWRAETVESTELIVILAPQRKTMVSRHVYPNGEPPIERFQYELDVRVIEAKTGNSLASRTFQNVPRALQKLEPFELTAIGSPVPFRTVYRWLAGNSLTGFVNAHAEHPIVNVVD